MDEYKGFKISKSLQNHPLKNQITKSQFNLNAN